MPCYRIRFMNEFARNHRLLRVCQRTIVIRSAESPDEAIEAAKSRFAGLEGIRDWRIHASMIEIEPLDAVPPPEVVGAGARPTASAHRSAR